MGFEVQRSSAVEGRIFIEQPAVTPVTEQPPDGLARRVLAAVVAVIHVESHGLRLAATD